MAGLDELTDEARRNTRGRFEQWVKNPQCETNTLSAVLNVKLADVALSLGYQPEYGQSPFAVTRGLQFEGWLFKDEAKVIRESMERVGILEENSSGFLDLRLTMNGGKSIKSVDAALEKSHQLLVSLSDDSKFIPPTIIAGLMLKIPKGVMLPEATSIIDVTTIQRVDDEWVIRVGEIKVFPDRGGHTDANEISTARAQAGVYQHALQITVDSLNLTKPPLVSRNGYLVFTWPGTNSPVIRANEDLTYQARRAALGFDRLDNVAQELISKQTKNFAEVDLKDWIAHSKTEYKEICWSFCDLAPRCQDLAIVDDRAIVLGTEASKLLGSVTISRAIGLLDGLEPNTEIERAVQAQLLAAKWETAK